MNNQYTLTDIEYSNRKKKAKREEFLDAMDEIIPWSYWVEMIGISGTSYNNYGIIITYYAITAIISCIPIEKLLETLKYKNLHLNSFLLYLY